MSITFTMWRLTDSDYREAAATGALTGEHVAESEEIYKSWDVLARILANGDLEHPALAAQAITGGDVLENEPMDYGGSRIIAPEKVAAISTELAAFPDDELVSRYHSLDFQGAYGGSAGRAPTSPLEDYLEAFHHLRDFYAQAAEAGNAMAVWAD